MPGLPSKSEATSILRAIPLGHRVEVVRPLAILRTAFLAFAHCVLIACGGSSGGASNPNGTAPPPAPPPSTPSPPPAPPPTNSAPTADDSRAAVGDFDGGGGVLSATASNGVTYTLEIPVGALADDVQIRMTPITDMGSAPLAAGLLGAVRFEPSGLTFLRPATLHIGASPTNSGRPLLAGFTSANDGSEFRLTTARLSGDELLVGISHFSIGGVSEATDAEIEAVPALVPLDPTARISPDDSHAALAALVLAPATLEQIAEVLVRWYVESVQPLIDQGDGANDPQDEGAAVAAYTTWIDAREAAIDLADLDRAALAAALATQDADANARLPRIFAALIDREIGLCNSERSLTELSRASMWQSTAADYGFANVESGLDRASFLRDANDCLRPVLNPIRLPTPLTPNSDASLDVTAQIIFNGATDPQGAPFEFRVTSPDATISTPNGFSDAAGSFTTVFRPTSSTMSVQVLACLVLPKLGTSDICVSESTGASNVDVRKGLRIALFSAFALPVATDPLIHSETITRTFDTGGRTPSTIEATGSVSSFVDTVSALAAGGRLEANASCTDGGEVFLSQDLSLRFDRETTLAYDENPSGTGPGSKAVRVMLIRRAVSGNTTLFTDISVPPNPDAPMPPISRSIQLEAGDYDLFVQLLLDCRRRLDTGSVVLGNPGVSAQAASAFDLRFQ